MWLVGTLEWTQIITAGIAALGAVTSTAIAAWVAYQVRTPSGDTLGQVAERTHDLATVSVKQLHGMNGHGENDASDPPIKSVG